MSLLQKITVRAALGRAALNTPAHAHPNLIPDWESLALVAFPALIVFCVCLADMLRGTGGAV